MELKIIDIDTKAVNNIVARLDDFNSSEDFKKFEQEYLIKQKPYYVYVKLPISDLADIHCLNKLGFEFIETQFEMEKSVKRIKNPYENAFDFVEVTSYKDLDKIIQLASTIFTDDRFTIDSSLPGDFAGKRYAEYIRQSFESSSEKVFALISKKDNVVCGLKSHKVISDKTVLLLLGGVDNKYKNTPIGLINAISEINYFVDMGYKKAVTHISARNTAIINLELSWLGYKVIEANVILRKIYEENLQTTDKND